MSEGFTIRCDGLHALQAQLVDLGAKLGTKVLAQAARKAFMPVFETARQLVPVGDTAELAFSIALAVKKTSSGEDVVRVGLKIVGKGGANGLPPARRWHFIEFGTSRMAAQPFMRPALDQNVQVVLELLKVELQKSINRALKRQAKGK